MMQQPTPTSTPAPSSSPPQDTGNNKSVPPPKNKDSPPFWTLIKLYTQLIDAKSHDQRRRVLTAYFNNWRRDTGYDLYPALRLILPQKDRERAVYGLKEKNIAKAYINAIGLNTKDRPAQRLMNWKRPTEKDKSSGDFPTVLYEVISERSTVTSSEITIDEVNKVLDDLALSSGNQKMQSDIFQRLYNQCTAEQHMWTVRIILKDLLINVKETTVFSVFHPDAHDLFNTCSDLKKVAWDLWNPNKRLQDDDKSVQLFRAFTPMLCKRPTPKIEESVKDMQGSTFIIEEKLDGERMQLHKRGNQYWYCSRKGKEYTYLYGAHVGEGSLTPHIGSAFHEKVEEIILDGEMLVWDPVSERNLPFGSLKTAALDKNKTTLSPRPCFKIFDLLYLNGISLIHRSLQFRKKNLHHAVKEVAGRMEFVTEWEGTTAKDVREKMEFVMRNRGEGLVLKHPKSLYVLNGRNKDWLKIKPEYMDNMGETVDVLVVAARYGSGKRGGGVSTFICAVRDDKNDELENGPKYRTFVRIGTGLTYTDYLWIRSLPWKAWDPNTVPEFLQVAPKTADDRGDVYLEPHESFLVQVKAAEITPSESFHTNYTMRFPRAMQIRHDLSVEDCMTISELSATIQSEEIKRRENQKPAQPRKKRRIKAKKPVLLSDFQSHDLKNVQATSNLLEGKTFMVISDPKSRTGTEDKKTLLELIKANGGKVVQMFSKKSMADPSLLVVYDGITKPHEIDWAMKQNTHDIIRSQWIMDSLAHEELVPMKKRYFFHATSARMEDEDYGIGEESDDVRMEETQETEDRSETLRSTPSQLSAGPSRPYEPGGVDPDADTEPESDADPESDNEDLRRSDGEAWLSETNDPSLDESASDIENNALEMNKISKAATDVKMGEDHSAMSYDQELIFKHLCFYLDSPTNARRHGMTVKSKHETQIEKSFQDLDKLIRQNGGTIADFDGPKLTHVVLDKRDDSRRLQLMKLTSQPKRRHLVLSDFIQACLDEGTLLDETDFAP